MKTSSLFFLFVGLFSLTLFSACGNDDDSDDATPNSRITIDGVDYELTKGFLESDEGFDPDTFDAFVYLAGDGISADQGGDFTGRGPFVVLSFVTSAEDALPNGTYTVVDETFDGAGAVVDADFSMDLEVGLDDALIGTTVTVSGTDTAKEITLNFTRQNGSSGSLNFVGALQLLD
ncbi:MAG: hypothetical protein AAGF87_10200 [Bacteroidota bacterium]